MTTRAKNPTSKPKGFSMQVILFELVLVNETLKHPEWVKSLENEYITLVANQSWVLVAPCEGAKMIGNKWIFHMMLKADISLERYKSRVVAKGYDQTIVINYIETFNHVVKPITFRIILTLALTHGWLVRQLDVNNTFLNSDLEEYVYMMQSERFVDKSKPHFV